MILARYITPAWALSLSLFFFVAFSVANVAQPEIMHPGEGGYMEGVLLYGAKMSLFLAFALLLYLGLGKTPREADSAPARMPARFYDPLLALRFTAGLMVVLGHGLDIFHPPGFKETLGSGGWQWLLTSSSWAGLWVFFTLSGYLMGKGFFMRRYHPDWKGTRNFYRNRFLRIVPLCWISVLIVSALLYPEIFRRENWGDLARIMLFDYDALQEINPIGPLFSLTTEMQFYAIVPLLYIGLGRNVTSLKAAIGIAAAFLAFGVEYRLFGYRHWPQGVYRPLLANIDIFMCGFLTNHVVAHALKRGIRLPRGLICGFALLLLLYLLASWIAARGDILKLLYWRSIYLLLCPMLVTLLTSAIICCFELGAQPDIPGPWLRLAKKTEILGLLTYAIYVWHYPVYEAFTHLRPATGTGGRPFVASWPDALQLVGAAGLATLAVSAIMHYAVEVPFERKKTYDRT